MEIFLRPETWLAVLTLTFFEIVLGIDNIIFISIVCNKVPREIRTRTRNTGLLLAMGVRCLLLLGITWVITFSEPLLYIMGKGFSGRDIILGCGGLFLIAKSTREINHEMEGGEEEEENVKPHINIPAVLLQIVMLDIIFSFDSILTAVGLTKYVQIMIVAVIISIGVMMIFSGPISDFINKHPTIEVLALGFLILIGFMLFLEGLHYEIPKGYIYFAVFFSVMVEMVNLRVRKRRIQSKRKKHG